MTASASDVTIENGTILGGYAGIWIDHGAGSVTVRRMRIQGGPSTYGLVAQGGPPSMPNSVFEDNVVLNCTHGVSLNVTGSLIRGNVVKSTTGYGMVISAHGNRIIGNLIEGCGSNGLHLNASWNHIADNLFYNNGGYGIPYQWNGQRVPGQYGTTQLGDVVWRHQHRLLRQRARRHVPRRQLHA